MHCFVFLRILLLVANFLVFGFGVALIGIELDKNAPLNFYLIIITTVFIYGLFIQITVIEIFLLLLGALRQRHIVRFLIILIYPLTGWMANTYLYIIYKNKEQHKVLHQHYPGLLLYFIIVFWYNLTIECVLLIGSICSDIYVINW